MKDPVAGTGRAKMHAVADALNRLVAELARQCKRDEGIRSFFYVGVVGYGDHETRPALQGFGNNDLVPIGDLANNYLRLEQRTQQFPDGQGGFQERQVNFPVWVEALARGNTPMCQALSAAEELASLWIRDHPSFHPPIVLNLTDAEVNDGDPLADARRLKSLESGDGNTLLFNLHVSGRSSTPLTFPDTDTYLPDRFSRTLFEMSSKLPPIMVEYAAKQGYEVNSTTRGLVYNADMTSIVHFMKVGTSISTALSLR